MPKIIVIGHLLLKLLQKMWSHVFLGHGVYMNMQKNSYRNSRQLLRKRQIIAGIIFCRSLYYRCERSFHRVRGRITTVETRDE